MLSKRATMALFAIAIASALLISNNFVGSAFAAKKKVYKEDDFSAGSLRSSTSVSTDDLGEDNEEDDGDTPRNNSKSKCDQAPTLAKQRECYRLACNDYD
jgi:hypothetical protein